MWFEGIWGKMPLDKSGISKKKLARIENMKEVRNWIEDGVTTALSEFAWDNLPETCDERMIERSALLYGTYMIAKVGEHYISPACVIGAGFNLYGWPVEAWGWGLNGFNQRFSVYVPGASHSPEVAKGIGNNATTDPMAVVGYDNADGYPYINYIMTAAWRMADALRAADVAVQNLKSPGIIMCDESQLSTVKDVLDKRSENVATIVAVKGSITDYEIKYFPTQMDPGVLKEFWNYFQNIRALNCEIMGQNANEQSDKKERLLVDEINSNNEQVAESANKRLLWRKRFCDQVNSVFGLGIGVHLRKEDYQDADDADRMDDGQPGGSYIPGDDRSGDPDGNN